MHLLYISSACKPFSAEQLYELLVTAREKNKALGVTGMLIYKGGNFLQLLEGESAAVLKVFDSIQKDTRHKDITNILQRRIEERVFRDWSMGFRYMDHNEALPIFDDYMSDVMSRQQFRENSKFAYQFINTFNQYNLH
jgi:hypothetical protein